MKPITPLLYTHPTHQPIAFPPERRQELRRALDANELDHIEFDAVTFDATIPNANHIGFKPDQLDAFAASFASKPFLRDHDTDHIDSRDGIIHASAHQNGQFVQRIRITTRRGMQDYLEGKIDRFSVAWNFSAIECTICGGNWMECDHWPGRSYAVNGVKSVCTLIFDNPTGKECSAVNDPAVPGTGIIAQLSALKTDALAAQSARSPVSPVPSIAHPSFTPKEPTTAMNTTTDTDTADTTALPVPPAAPAAPAFLSAATRQSIAEQITDEAQDWIATLRANAIAVQLATSPLTPENRTAVQGLIDTLTAQGAMVTPDTVTRLIAAQATAQAAAQPHPVHGVNPLITARHMTTGADDAQNAMNWLMGDKEAALPPPSLRNIRDLYLDITGDVGFHGKFDPQYAKLATATTSTLAGLAANALNKVVLQHYANLGAFRWFEPLVAVLPHDGSTQPVQMIMMDGVANLPTVNEGNAYTEASVGDSKESIAFTKKGVFVGITLEMYRRSDIAKMQAIPKALMAACMRTRSAAVAAIFTQAAGVGPTMADDSLALFHATHGNLATTAFSYAAWTAARTECYKQVVPGTGERLTMWPKFALVPPDLYDVALETFGYASGSGGKPGTANNDGNAYGISRDGDPRPAIVAVPQFTDTTDWAWMVDPNLHPTLCMTYANGPAGGAHALPEIFTANNPTEGLMFTNDTLPVKIRDYFGVGVATYVGIGKRNVAGV